jgi:hypothetical protein
VSSCTILQLFVILCFCYILDFHGVSYLGSHPGSQEVTGSTPVCSTPARRSELRWTESTCSSRGRDPPSVAFAKADQIIKGLQISGCVTLSFLPAFCQLYVSKCRKTGLIDRSCPVLGEH